MTASSQRIKNRKSQLEKLKQKNNEKKRKNLDKIRANVQYDKRGRQKKTKPNLISNVGKNPDYGQRAAKLKESLGGIGSMKDYKKTEKKAFKNAKQEKKKLIQERKDKKKGSSSLKIGKYFTWKGKRYRSGSVTARKAENQMRARKRAQEMARNRK